MRLSYKIDTAGFEVLKGPALLTILQLEDLDMSEKDLFKAVNGWAGRQCYDKNVEITGPNMRKVSFFYFYYLLSFKFRYKLLLYNRS